MSKINGTKVKKNTQLHNVTDWNADNIVFADPEYCTVPNSEPAINYARVNIMTQNHKLNEEGQVVLDDKGLPVNDDSIGDLVLSFPRMFSFGVQENVSQETKAVTGHSMSFALFSREGATEDEIRTVKKLEEIIQKCRDQLFAIKDTEPLKKMKKNKNWSSLEAQDLKDLDKMLYYKLDENNDRILGQGPTFSPKLIEYKERVDKKTGKTTPYQMATVFYLENEVDENGDPIEVSPLEYLSTKTDKKYCFCRPAIKIDSLFVGAKVVTIKCLLTEADVAPVQMGPQRLLHGRQKVVTNNKLIMSSSKVNPMISAPVNDEKNESQDNIESPPELNDNPVSSDGETKKIKKKVKKTEE